MAVSVRERNASRSSPKFSPSAFLSPIFYTSCIGFVEIQSAAIRPWEDYVCLWPKVVFFAALRRVFHPPFLVVVVGVPGVSILEFFLMGNRLLLRAWA